MRQLLDVVHQTEELPLRIHLLLPAQREAIQPLVVSEVGKHRFHGGEAPAIEPPASFGVDRPLHAIAVAQRGAGRLAMEEADLPGLRHVGLPQALVAQGAGSAIPQRALELHRQVAIVIAV